MKIKTPPMGWNSWDCWGAAVNEETVRKNAEFMAKHLKQYGWEYVVVDIQWYEPTADSHAYHPIAELCMDEYSRLIPAENRFPSAKDDKGFAPLAEYIHSLGLKFGIHIMRGIPRQAVHRNTKLYGTEYTARDIVRADSICQWNSDMYGTNAEHEGAVAYYKSLFDLYRSWGVDFIKCDDICRELPKEEKELALLSNSLKHCGRDMVLSLSPGPALLERAELYKTTADMWRITDDFWDNWDALYQMFYQCERWSIHNGAGHWADADMLPIGAVRQDYGRENRTNFTENEQMTMLTLWSIFRSPLMIGGDLQECDDFTLKLLTNAEIIGMNKNSRHAHQVWRRKLDTEWVLWVAQCAEGGIYAAVFNIGDTEGSITIPLTDLEIYENADCKELWTGEVTKNISALEMQVPNHGVKAYRIVESETVL